MTTDAIAYALIKSLKSHIQSQWAGDVYDYDGNLVQTAFCPTELTTTLSYVDKDGVTRIFGPSLVEIGRVLEDTLSLPHHMSVPSAYIEVSNCDFEEVESWRHSLMPSLDGGRPLAETYPFEIGGAHGMVRRLIVKMTTYFIDSDQNVAEVHRLGNAAASFIESMVTADWEMPRPWAWQLHDETGAIITDPFGERPWRAYPAITHSRVRGGTPDNLIFDIKVYFEVYTRREI